MSTEEWVRRRPHVTSRRYAKARDAWLSQRGIRLSEAPEALRQAVPWSIEYFQENNPDWLADRLRAAGLPSGWRPE